MKARRARGVASAPMLCRCVPLLLLLASGGAAETARLVFTDGHEQVVILLGIDANQVRCLLPWRDARGHALVPRSYPAADIAEVTVLPGADPFPPADAAAAPAQPTTANLPGAVTVLPHGAFTRWLAWDRRRRALAGELRQAVEAVAAAQARQTHGLAAMAREEEAIAAARDAIPAAQVHEARQAQREADAEAAFRSAEAVYYAELQRSRHAPAPPVGSPGDFPPEPSAGIDPRVAGFYEARRTQWLLADRDHDRAAAALRGLEERVAQGNARLRAWTASRDALIAELAGLVDARARAEAALDAWVRDEPPRREPAAEADAAP